MNRRLIFAVVITALLVNLAIGAQIYLAAQGRPSKEAPATWKTR